MNNNSLTTIEKYNFLEESLLKKIKEKEEELKSFEEAHKGSNGKSEKEVEEWSKITHEKATLQDHLDTVHHFGSSDKESIDKIYKSYQELYKS